MFGAGIPPATVAADTVTGPATLRPTTARVDAVRIAALAWRSRFILDPSSVLNANVPVSRCSVRQMTLSIQFIISQIINPFPLLPPVIRSGIGKPTSGQAQAWREALEEQFQAERDLATTRYTAKGWSATGARGCSTRPGPRTRSRSIHLQGAARPADAGSRGM
jgi:hypothetical protein